MHDSHSDPNRAAAMDEGGLPVESLPNDPLPVDSLLGVVLAGGRSSRMGQDKAALKTRTGETFLQHAIARLSEVVTAVAVSGRPSLDERVATIPDRSPEQGPAMAVWSAIEFARAQGFLAVIVTPVDMPNLTSEHLRMLVGAATGDRPTCIVSDIDTLHPLVAAYPVSLAEDLQAVALSPRRSLRDWLDLRVCNRLHLPPTAVCDLNKPEDLTQMQS